MYQVHPNRVCKRKKQALELLPQVIADRRANKQNDRHCDEAKLYQQIGQLTVEADFLKKSWSCYRQVRDMIDGLGAYFDFYNDRRLHQSVGYRIPAEVHFENRLRCFASPREAPEEQCLWNAKVITL